MARDINMWLVKVPGYDSPEPYRMICEGSEEDIRKQLGENHTEILWMLPITDRTFEAFQKLVPLAEPGYNEGLWGAIEDLINAACEADEKQAAAPEE